MESITNQGMIRLLLLLLTMLFTSLPLSAQELSVKSFGLVTNDATAMDEQYQRVDNNGNLAGLVKVQIALDNVKFDGGMVLDQKKWSASEYWVWMADGATKLTVVASGFLPLDLNFRDYDFKMLHSKNTYKLVITVPTGVAQPQDDGMSFLTLKVEPSNAQVVIDNGKPKQPENGEVQVLLSRGDHSYEVSANGYASKRGTVTIGNEKKEITVKLVSTMAQLRVECPTTGAQVYVNQKLKGTVPWTGSLDAETYRIEVRREGYRSQTQTVNLAESEARTVSFTALTAITGNLSIAYTPSGSEVYIDGKKVGTTPDIFRNIPIGQHEVEIRKDGYSTEKLKPTIKENETNEITGSLTALNIKKDVNNLSDQGMTPAQMYALGDDYYYGRNGKSKDYAEAVKWYRKAAEQGHAKAQSDLGYMYHNGYGVEKDDSEAVKWYRKAAEQGYARAQFDLGVMYRNGRGVTQNDAEAVKWYRKAAEQGHADGQYNLGYMYLNGYGVEKDYAEAVKWYRKLAEQGHAGGQYNLGLMYAKGMGVPQDYSEAVNWYRKAAEQGNAQGQCNLGYMYRNGYGVEKDDSEAVKWYRKAAEQGNAQGQCNLGYMYEKGYGVEKDYSEAVKWYRKSAEQGNAYGQSNLGEMYENGNGVAKDLTQAKYWYEKAAAQGNEDAKNNLKRLNGN